MQCFVLLKSVEEAFIYARNGNISQFLGEKQSAMCSSFSLGWINKNSSMGNISIFSYNHPFILEAEDDSLQRHDSEESGNRRFLQRKIEDKAQVVYYYSRNEQGFYIAKNKYNTSKYDIVVENEYFHCQYNEKHLYYVFNNSFYDIDVLHSEFKETQAGEIFGDALSRIPDVQFTEYNIDEKFVFLLKEEKENESHSAGSHAEPTSNETQQAANEEVRNTTEQKHSTVDDKNEAAKQEEPSIYYKKFDKFYRPIVPKIYGSKKMSKVDRTLSSVIFIIISLSVILILNNEISHIG